MKTKFVNVRDKVTEMKFIVLQMEEIDEAFINSKGLRKGYKIVIQLMGGHVAAAGGMKFIPEHIGSSIEDRSHKIVASGTEHAFGMLLNSVDNIRTLPDTIDIEPLRLAWANLRKRINVRSKLIESDIDMGESNIKKIFFKIKDSPRDKIGLIDSTYNCIHEVSSSSGNLNGDYLWLPFDELNDEEWRIFVKNSDYYGPLERIVNI